MDSADSANLDFYESDLAIAQYTKKLRADDLKIVTSIPPKLMSFTEEGTLDTPEVSFNLSDYIDTPELNKFTTGEGLFPNILTSSQEEKSQQNTCTNVTLTVTDSVPDIETLGERSSITNPTPNQCQSLVEVKPEPEFVDIIDVPLAQTEEIIVPSSMSEHMDIQTVDISILNRPPVQNIVVKKEKPELEGQYTITIPESPCMSDSSRSFDYMDSLGVPTPVHEVGADYEESEYTGKSPAMSKAMRKRELEKGSEEYRLKRERNNVAVRKSREKARDRQRLTEQKVKTLVQDNKQLSKKLELVTKELTVLRGLFNNANLRGLISPQHQKLLDKLNR